MKLPLRDCGRFDTVKATQKQQQQKYHYLSFCPKDASKSSNNHKFLSLLNKNEVCSVKIPPQRNNISSSVTFLKIALPIFSRKKKLIKSKSLQWLPCAQTNLWRHFYHPAPDRHFNSFVICPSMLCDLHISDLFIPCSFYGVFSSNATAHTLTY